MGPHCNKNVRKYHPLNIWLCIKVTVIYKGFFSDSDPTNDVTG